MPQDYKLLIVSIGGVTLRPWFGIDGPTYEDSRAMLEAAMENRSSQELRVFAQILLEKAENKNALGCCNSVQAVIISDL